MTLAELITAFRSDADDIAEPYLWSDAEVTTWLNDAEAEAATRASLLIETSNDTYCDLDIDAGTAHYMLHAQVLVPKRISLDNDPLLKTTREKLDLSNPGWESETGTPTKYIHTGQYIQLYPIPKDDATLKLVVSRLPVEMEASGPEIHPRYHLKLLAWVMHKAFSKRDVDTYSQSTANIYEKRFEDYFGSSQSANVQQQQLNQRPDTPTDRPTWF